MKSDKELAKSFKLSIGDDDIVYLEFLSQESEDANNIRISEIVVKSMTKLLDEAPEKDYSMLIDLTKIGTIMNLPDKSKEIYSKDLIFKRMAKIAVVTPNLFVKMLTSALSLSGGKYEGIKSFDTRQEALGWLKPSK